MGLVQILPYFLAALAAYLLGSIPTGYLVARHHGNVDLLSHGSKRTGATNVLRTLGWRAAAVVFVGDFGKGVLAVVAARLLANGDPVADVVAGLSVLAGHNYSVFLRFRGGRGVFAGAGTLVVIAPLATIAGALVATAIIALTRYVSLGSILAASTIPLVLLALVLTRGQSPLHLLYTVAGSAFVIASHRDNISRLLHGTERKFGQKVRM